MTQPLRHPALYHRHVALGAKFAAFGGWEMPLEYAGGGVLKEHAAVRADVGVFDVSHLGKARVRGRGAARFVNACLSNDLDRIGAGQAQYTLCLADNGGVVDDLIAYRFGDDDIFLIPNAANTAEVVRRLVAAAPNGISVVDQHELFAVLAVQRPPPPRPPPASWPPRPTGSAWSISMSFSRYWRCKARARPSCSRRWACRPTTTT